MLVDPFIAGVFCTIFCEFLSVFVYAILKGWKK